MRVFKFLFIAGLSLTLISCSSDNDSRRNTGQDVDANSEDTFQYNWEIGEWSLCASGSQSRVVVCVEQDQRQVSSHLCSNVKPPETQACTASDPVTPEEQITQLFQQYLNRAPDQAGLDYYLNQIDEGTSLESIEMAIANSLEARVRIMFYTYFSEYPSVQEQFQETAYAKQTSLTELESQFRTSVYCQTNCLETELKSQKEAHLAELESYYSLYLERTPDIAGLNYWMNEVLNGRSHSEVADAISGSAEANIREYYQTHLLRKADFAGLQYYLNLHASGQSLEQIRTSLRASSECQSDCL